MQRNVLEYIDATAERVPYRTAFADETEQLTFRQFRDGMRSIGSELLRLGFGKEPVLVYMQKSPKEIQAFFGVISAGCYYVPLDEEMPFHRIELIIENTQAKALICDEHTREFVEKLDFKGKVFMLEQIRKAKEDAVLLSQVREQSLDTDPIYVLFTSGSTGIPKGVIGHHRGVIDYIDQLTEIVGADENSIFGNQCPLYVDACMKDIYLTLKCGATDWLIPKKLFMFPLQLVQYLNEHHINTVCWVVSALTMISAFDTFSTEIPKYLRTVAFGSEVFPVRQFNLWKKTLPDAKFINLYGPTECTGVSCYYYADRLFGEDEAIPIGRAFPNTEVMLLKEDGTPVDVNEQGEIYIRGTCVTHGYYNNPEKTKEAFVQNPLNPNYPEIVYRTGDLGKYNDDGELVFLSRKDYQIKHMGHRIELGEIDAAVLANEEIRSCCAIYVKEDEKIVLFYAGTIAKRQLTGKLKEKLPRYMIPNTMIQMDELPMTTNGKMDRLKMQSIYQERKKEREKHNG